MPNDDDLGDEVSQSQNAMERLDGGVEAVRPGNVHVWARVWDGEFESR